MRDDKYDNIGKMENSENKYNCPPVTPDLLNDDEKEE
jgi:hypothetical protein